MAQRRGGFGEIYFVHGDATLCKDVDEAIGNLAARTGGDEPMLLAAAGETGLLA